MVVYGIVQCTASQYRSCEGMAVAKGTWRKFSNSEVIRAIDRLYDRVEDHKCRGKVTLTLLHLIAFLGQLEFG